MASYMTVEYGQYLTYSAELITSWILPYHSNGNRDDKY